MKTNSSQSRFQAGFTLIELLVVIAIIGILAAMLFPAISRAKTAALVAKAKTEINDIVQAVNSYEKDYNGRFPAPGVSSGSTDVTFGYPNTPVVPGITNITSNSNVMAVLLDLEKFANGLDTVNKGHVLNPRRLVTLPIKQVTETNAPGLGPDGVYRDPFGNPYIISMDTSLDGKCRDNLYSRKNVSQDSGQRGLNGLFNPTTGGNTDEFEYNGSVMVWSFGPDGKADPNTANLATGKANKGVNADNIISW